MQYYYNCKIPCHFLFNKYHTYLWNAAFEKFIECANQFFKLSFKVYV